MFPSFRQRLLVLVAMIACGLMYLYSYRVMLVDDGARGATLLFAASPVGAIGRMMVVTVAAILVGSLVAAIGSPLAGVFTMAAALTFAAVPAGTIHDFIMNASGGGDYYLLAVELLVWGVILLGSTVAIFRLSFLLRCRLPNALLAGDTWRDELDVASQKPDGGIFWGYTPTVKKSGPLANVPPSEGGDSSALPLWQQGLAATLVTMLIGGLASHFLLRSQEVFQCLWSLGFAFCFGAVIAHQIFPLRNPLYILAAPFVAGMIFYIYTGATLSGGDELSYAFVTPNVPRTPTIVGPAMALPIFYASAGLAGAVIGLGWSHILHLTHQAEELTEREAAEEADGVDKVTT